ncbi:MAG: sodium:proton antiporter [Campylobacter sp.]|nr:sodium:proton antiporter [Campylobacter sp.]
MIEETIKFKDQLDAAEKLLEILPKKEILERKSLAICPSLDSVILVDKVCSGLGINYEMLFCEPIVAPNNPECAIAVVSETEDVVANDALIDSFGITYDFVYGEASRKYEEKILQNIYKFRKGNLIGELKDRNILLIDEGCETGLTALVCIKTLINMGAKTISYATPVIAHDVASALGNLLDEIHAVDRIFNFIEVDNYYESKFDASDEKIMAILEDSPRYLPLKKTAKGEDE